MAEAELKPPLPTVPAPSATGSRRLDVVLVSGDDEFLITLGPHLGDRYRTHSVDSPEPLPEGLESRPWFAIVDAASLPDARAAVARMNLAYPNRPIIVVAAAGEEWQAAAGRGSISSVVARQDIGTPRLSQALTTAEQALAQAPAQAAPASAGGGGAASAKFGAAAKLASIALAVTVALGALGWWLAHRSSSVPVSSSAPSVPGPAVPEVAPEPMAPVSPRDVTQLLSAARVAFRDEKLMPKPDGDLHGDSALELYSQVLAQDPANDEANDGVGRIFNLAKPRIQSDLTTGKFEDATRLLGLFKSASVSADSAREIEASMTAARPKWLATHVQESIAAGDLAGAEQGIAQLTSMGADRNTLTELRRALENKRLEQQVQAGAVEVRAAISAGNLLEPANDNARTRLQALRGLSRNSATTVAVQREVQAALLERSQDAGRKGQFDVAKRYLTAASEIGSNSEVNDTGRQLQADMDQAAQRAATAEAEAKAREAAAASAALAAANTPAATTTTQYISPHPLQQLPVKYPPKAYQEQLRGYVVVEFTLRGDGTAVDATVVEAHPAHVFDAAATTAVLGVHYDTAPLAGRDGAKARIRISFKPD